MAIIRLPTEVSRLESIVMPSLRPAILIKNGTMQFDELFPLWADILKTNRAILERSIRAVGRVETPDGRLSWVGTAFVVDKTLAVTANYVAEILAQQPGDRSGKLSGAWLNFTAEHGNAVNDRVAIRKVHLVHPYWGFAFLELEHDVDPTRILTPSPKQSAEELQYRETCVIGYPAFDLRNEPGPMKLIFGDVFDVKRLMPGTVQGIEQWGSEKSVALRHDATTLGGTGGAPLIDIQTGLVLGIEVGGQYLHGNYAVPAWEIGRDPQWWHNMKSGTKHDVPDLASVLRQAIGVDEEEKPILSFDDVLVLHKSLVKIGITTDDKVDSLFGGLPKDFVGALPSKGGPTERLLAMLHAVNDTGGRIRGRSAFYYLLKNSETMRTWDTKWASEVQIFLNLLIEREKKPA